MPRRLLRLLPLLLLIAACDTGDVDAEPDCTGGASGSFTATIDGAPFEAEYLTFTFTQNDLSVTGSVTADGLQQRLTIVVTDIALGSFPVGSGAAATYEETEGGETRRYTASDGEVFILQDFPENPSGTFAFTARGGGETVTITG